MNRFFENIFIVKVLDTVTILDTYFTSHLLITARILRIQLDVPSTEWQLCGRILQNMGESISKINTWNFALMEYWFLLLPRNPTPSWVQNDLGVTWPDSGNSGLSLNIGFDLEVESRPINVNTIAIETATWPVLAKYDGCSLLSIANRITLTKIIAATAIW